MFSAFLTAAILGFKHALDPDHIAATMNMTLSDKLGTRSAAKLGASWGVGHGASMLAFGLPVVLLSQSFPEWFYTSAELAIGVIIIYLGLKLFVQWFKGEFHPHEIQKLKDKHIDHHKAHKRAGAMGFLHGVGGSYGGALLLLTTFSSTLGAAVGLVIFTLLSVLSMSLVTTLFSYATKHHLTVHVLDRLVIPVFIVITVVFGYTYLNDAAKALGLW